MNRQQVTPEQMAHKGAVDIVSNGVIGETLEEQLIEPKLNVNPLQDKTGFSGGQTSRLDESDNQQSAELKNNIMRRSNIESETSYAEIVNNHKF